MESQSYSNELELSVNNFLDYCANYRNLSNYTLRNYDSDLNHFLEYIKSYLKIGKFTIFLIFFKYSFLPLKKF